MPSQSWFPILTASAILVAGLLFANHHMPGAIAGAALMILSIWFWSLEGPGGYHVHLTRDTQ
jgi:cytochrome c oxidase subunit 1